MHILVLALVAVGIVSSAWALLPFIFAATEAPRAKGALSEALFSALRQRDKKQDLTEVFGRFVDPRLPLKDRSSILVSNGFMCMIGQNRPDSRDRIFTCHRPTEGTSGCEGFSYFTYQARDGTFFPPSGNSYFVDGDRRTNGACNNNLRCPTWAVTVEQFGCDDEARSLGKV